GNAAPEALKGIAGTIPSAKRMPADQRCSIHCTRGRARDRVNPEPVLFEKAVEQPPGVRAVRTASLSCEINENGITSNRDARWMLSGRYLVRDAANGGLQVARRGHWDAPQGHCLPTTRRWNGQTGECLVAYVSPYWARPK